MPPQNEGHEGNRMKLHDSFCSPFTAALALQATMVGNNFLFRWIQVNYTCHHYYETLS